MLHFEGDKTFPQPPDDLCAKLSDARYLVECIPDVESVSQSDPSTATCVVRPGFAFVRGTLTINLSVTNALAGKTVQCVARSKGIGSTSIVEAALTFAPEDQGTRVHWTADVQELGGLLRAVPKGLIQASAQKVIADVWKAIESKLAS